MTNTNDFADITAFNGITFNAGAGAFTPGGDITNNSASLQTINLNLKFSANRTVDTANGDVTIAGSTGRPNRTYNLRPPRRPHPVGVGGVT